MSISDVCMCVGVTPLFTILDYTPNYLLLCRRVRITALRAFQPKKNSFSVTCRCLDYFLLGNGFIGEAFRGFVCLFVFSFFPRMVKMESIESTIYWYQ